MSAPVSTLDSIRPPRSIEVVTMLGDSVVQVAHCVDPKSGRLSRLTRGLAATAALSLVASAIAFVVSVRAARADDAALAQWTRDHKPVAAYRHHRIGFGLDVVAFGGLALGLGALVFGLARARAERRSPSFRIGTAPGVDQPVELAAPSSSFPLVAPGGDDFVFNFATGIDGELISATERTSLAALAATGRARPSTAVAGAYELAIPSDAKIRARAGQTTFLVAAVARPRGTAVPLVQLDRRTMSYVAGSLVGHLGLLALLQLAPVNAGAATMEMMSAENTGVSARNTASDDMVEPRVETDGDSGSDGGGTTQIAVQDPGQAGSTQATANDDARRQIKDNNVPPQMSRESAREYAATAGILGASPAALEAAFAALTATSDISSGLDKATFYGGLYGADGSRLGFGQSSTNFGLGGDLPGWGLIGSGTYGTICRGDVAGSCKHFGDGYVGPGGIGGRGPKRVAAVPTVVFCSSNCGVSGGLDKAIIRRYIKREMTKIGYCYEKQLLGHPSLLGEIAVEFFITPTGGVQGAKAAGFNSDVASCVADVIAGIEFPKSRDGGTQVHYPFNFRPAGA